MELAYSAQTARLGATLSALPGRALDALAEAPVRRKVTALLLVFAVAIPLLFLAILHGQGPEQAQSALVLYLAAAVMLLAPLSALVSHVLALRSIRELDGQCLRLKRGDFALEELPPERGEEHDFQRLKRNLHWMGYALKSREDRLAAAVEQLAEAQRQIGESIEYASHIQRAFLTGAEALGPLMERAAGPGRAEHFLVVRQLGSVGGDACWFRSIPGGFLAAVIDCTGHGVPGAFMTLIVHALLEQAAREQEVAGGSSPGELLGRVNRLIKEALGQFGAGSLSDDGMDCSLCRVEPDAGRLTFAGARGALYVVRDGQADIVKGGARGAGYVRTPADAHYEDTVVALAPGQRFFMASDGLTDQVGGPERLPFGRRRFMEYLAQTHDRPLAGQGRELLDVIDTYRGAEPQRDDLTVLGFSLNTENGR
jgi:serine phosphatase RsbU (regulator of sigma subunit)